MSDFIRFLLEIFIHPLPLKDRIAIVLSILWCLTVYILAAFIVGEPSTYMFVVFWLKFSSPVFIYWPVRLFYVRKKLLSSDYSHSNPNNQHQPDIKPIMSLPATKFWLSTSVRRNRMSFIFAILLMIIAICLAGLVVVGLVVVLAVSGGLENLVFIVFVLLLPLNVCQHLLIAQRLRDFNVSGWFVLVYTGIWILTYFIPPDGTILFGLFSLAAFIVLCVIPGTKGPNKYGDDPLQVTPAPPLTTP